MLLNDDINGYGGIAQYNRELLDSLLESDDFARVSVMHRGDSEQSPSDKGYFVSGRSSLTYLFQSLRWMFSPFDVLFCGHINLLPLALFLAWLRRKPVWLQVHGIEVFELRSRLTQKLLSNVELVTAVSRYTRSDLLRKTGLAPWQVRVLPNTVAKKFKPHAGPSDFAHKMEIHGRHPILLTVGRLSSQEMYKGHDLVLDALDDLLNEFPEAIYLIAGAGDDVARLRGQVTSKGLEKHVHFLGFVPDQEMNALYSMADLFVMASTEEGFGIVYLEALACGTPVLALNRRGSKDPCQDGELGHLAEPDNFAETLKEVVAADDRIDLSDRVHEVFGAQNFKRQLGLILRSHLGAS